MATLILQTWGTLIDDRSVEGSIEPHVSDSKVAADIARSWLQRQKSATSSAILKDLFVPYRTIDEACLCWALDYHNVELDQEQVRKILSRYRRLYAYPEVVGALKDLKMQGHTLKIVATPTREIIEAHSTSAGILEYIDEIISAGDELFSLKPAGKVFQLGIERAGCPQDHLVWVSADFWEVVGAAKQGLATAWTNRSGDPMRGIGVTPTHITRNLQELADRLGAQRRPRSYAASGRHDRARRGRTEIPN